MSHSNGLISHSNGLTKSYFLPESCPKEEYTNNFLHFAILVLYYIIHVKHLAQCLHKVALNKQKFIF